MDSLDIMIFYCLSKLCDCGLSVCFRPYGTVEKGDMVVRSVSLIGVGFSTPSTVRARTRFWGFRVTVNVCLNVETVALPVVICRLTN